MASLSQRIPLLHSMETVEALAAKWRETLQAFLSPPPPPPQKKLVLILHKINKFFDMILKILLNKKMSERKKVQRRPIIILVEIVKTNMSIKEVITFVNYSTPKFRINVLLLL